MFAVSNPRRVWLITLAHGVNEFYSVALPPILPLLVNDFSISYGEAGVLLAVFFAVYSVFQLPAGVLADRVGRRWLLAGGMVTLAGGTLLAAGAESYRTLVVAQAVAGVGGSTYHPTGMSLISDLETGGTEGRAMGIHGLGGVVGTALAPALVGGLAAVFDWRLALSIAAAVGLVYAVAFAAAFRDTDDGGDERAGRANGGSPRPADGPGGGSDAGPSQSGRRRLVSVPLERWVVVLFLANLAISTEIGAVRTFVTTYLVEHGGMTAGVANGVFFVMLAGAGISSIGAGSLADTVDRATFGLVTMAVSAVLLGATALLPPDPVAVVAWFFLLGVALWAALPAMNAITSAYSEREFSGSLFGVMLTAGSLGGAGGPLLFGVAVERFGPGTAFPMIAGVSVAGAGVFLVLYRL